MLTNHNGKKVYILKVKK